MNIIPPPLKKHVDIKIRILYCLTFAVAAAILSKWQLFGPIAWLFFGISLQWVWVSFPIVKAKRRRKLGNRKANKLQKKAKKNKTLQENSNNKEITKLPSRRLENATQYPKYDIELDYSFEQVVHAFFNKYKDPLPDPEFPEILSIVVNKDETLSNGLILKRRTFTIKNEEDMPYVMRQMLSADTVVFEENCIIDMKNKTLEMSTHNASFSGLGQMLDLQYLKVDPTKPGKTIFTETGEVSLFGVPWLLRSKAEGLVVEGFKEKFDDSITYFKQRLAKLFPPSTSSSSPSPAPLLSSSTTTTTVTAVAPEEDKEEKKADNDPGDDDTNVTETKSNEDNEIINTKDNDIQIKFERAVKYLKEEAKDLKISNADGLELYGYYKVVMVGKCNIQQPGLFDVKKKAKYEAWKRKETMSKVEAMNGYINVLQKLSPNWEESSPWP